VGAGFLLGVMLGAIAWGVPLDARGEFAGSLRDLIHPYTVWTGVTAVALFMMHGAIYLHLKTEGELQDRIREWIRPTIIFFILSYAVLTVATALYAPQATAAVRQTPALFVVVVLTLLAIANIPREIFHNRSGRAFISSSAVVALLLVLFGLNSYPTLLHSRPNPELSLTAYDAASSEKTLTIMLIIALIGIPIVLTYTASIYWIFRGKVKLTESSY
jgi:cytochrome d ubiquinol oxidase subunit II